MLETKNLTVRYGTLEIIKNITFSLEENQWLMLVGPNGAGKSTIVKAISQAIPYLGAILFEGRNTRKMKPSKIARNIGALSQSREVTYSFTVGEIVRLGRYSYSSGIFSSMSEEDDESVRQALEMTGMSDMEDQSALTLSGGELQRAFLAQIFAQDPKLLILDEPTNHLDLVYQKQIFTLIGEWIKRPGRAVISVVHDLSLARAHGTDIMLLDKGSVVSMGKAQDVLSRENLQAVYSMDVYDWMKKMLCQWED